MTEPPRRPQRRRPQDADEAFEALIRETSEQPEPSVASRVREIVTPLRAGLFIAFIVVIIVIRAVMHMFDPPGDPANAVVVEIPEGATTTQITEQLAGDDVVPSAWALRAWIRLKGESNLQAGEYTFHTNSSAGQALAVLKSGPDLQVDRVTIPEGFRVAQIADRVGRLPGMTSQRFLDIVNSGRIRSEFQPADSRSLEGFMFPDTYLIDAGDNEETLARRMVGQFDTVARLTGLNQSSRAIAKNPYETLIIASMIEAEAGTNDDRGKISQVIQNRLFQGMPLQIDATVLYALNNSKQSVSLSDLQVDSPYNTYKNRGLPPGPINNPGRASIQAALAPEQGPWLYYSLWENGSHRFATTREEHDRYAAEARARGLF